MPALAPKKPAAPGNGGLGVVPAATPAYGKSGTNGTISEQQIETLAAVPAAVARDYTPQTTTKQATPDTRVRTLSGRSTASNYASDIQSGKTAADVAKQMAPAMGEKRPTTDEVKAAENKVTKATPAQKKDTSTETVVVNEDSYTYATPTDGSTGSTGSTSSTSGGLLSSLTGSGSKGILLLGALAGGALWYYTRGRKK